MPEKETAMQVIAKALKPGGYGYLVTKTPQQGRRFGKKVSSPVHQTQVSSADLQKVMEKSGLQVIKKIHVTCVFPGLRSGMLDRMLTSVCRLLPYHVGVSVSESYAIVFKKNDS